MMTKGALEQMVSSINDNESRVRMGVDHRRDFPPMGRLENAELVEKDGYFYVEADYITFEKSEPVAWNKNLVTEYFNNTFQFAEVDSTEATSISVSVDPHNFTSFKEVAEFRKHIEYNSDTGVSVKLHGRKSLIPDPEVIFQLTKTFLFYHLLKPTVKKIGKKVSDEVSESIVKEGTKITSLISKTIKEAFFRCIPKARPIAVVFEIPGKPHIELIARTRDEKLVLKSLSKKRITEMKEELDDLSKNVSIAKIQFLLNEKGKWKFNFLITDKGAAIGTKISFTRRDKKFEMMGREKNKRNKKLN